MRTCLLALVVLIVLLPKGAVLGQPSIPKSEVPTDLPADVRKLVEGLYSSSPLERGQAAWDLGEAGARAARAVPFLIGMLPDRDNKIALPSRYVKDLGYEMTNVGIEAAIALGKIGKPAVGPLIQVLASRDVKLTTEAAAVLASITGQPFGTDYSKWIAWWEKEQAARGPSR